VRIRLDRRFGCGTTNGAVRLGPSFHDQQSWCPPVRTRRTASFSQPVGLAESKRKPQRRGGRGQKESGESGRSDSPQEIKTNFLF